MWWTVASGGQDQLDVDSGGAQIYLDVWLTVDSGGQD